MQANAHAGNDNIYVPAGGSGVFATGSATAAIDDSIVDGNSAGSYGGGVFVDSMATLKLDSATITGNHARTGYPSPGTGGGVYVTAPAAATASSSVLAYNMSSALVITPNDCAGTLLLNGYDFVGSNDGGTVTPQPARWAIRSAAPTRRTSTRN